MSEPLLSAADIADLTAINESAMPNTCTISTPGTPVSDGAGGTTPGTPTTVTCACDLVPVSGDESGAQQIKERGSYRLFIPKTVTISATSTVTVGGRSYNVIWTPPVLAWDTARRVGLEEVV